MHCRGEQQGETEQRQPRHPGTQGWGHSLWGRVAGHHIRQGSPKDEVGTPHRPHKNAVSPDFPGLVSKGQWQIWGMDPVLEQDGRCRDTVPGLHGGRQGLRWASPPPSAAQPAKGNHGPRDRAVNTLAFAHKLKMG